jgi:hypothetical protein
MRDGTSVLLPDPVGPTTIVSRFSETDSTIRLHNRVEMAGGAARVLVVMAGMDFSFRLCFYLYLFRRRK